MSSTKRRLLVADSSSSDSDPEEEEEEEEEAPAPPRPRRSAAATKTYSAYQARTSANTSTSDGLDDILQEEDVSMWKEEDEDERDRRVHFVVDDDGAGYADDDADHRGKEYAALVSDDEDQEEAGEAATSKHKQKQKKQQQQQSKRQQQDLFTMFTKVERKNGQQQQQQQQRMEDEDTDAAAASFAALHRATTTTGQAGLQEDEEEDLMAALLASKSSKKPAAAAAASKSKKPAAAAPAARRSIQALAPAPPRRPVVAAAAKEEEEADISTYMEDADAGGMVFGDDNTAPSPPSEPAAAAASQEEEEEEIATPAPSAAAPVAAAKLSTRARLLAAAAAKPVAAAVVVSASVPSSSSVDEQQPLPESVLPSAGSFLPTTSSSSSAPTVLSATSSFIFPTAPPLSTDSSSSPSTTSDSIEFFWTDMYETRPGEIYLFGRVETPSSESSSSSPTTTSPTTSTTSSCCVCLKNVSRSLVVLPRFPCDTDEERKLVADEVLASVRQQRLDKQHQSGMRFKTKWVTRSYAFELPDIPRGESQYLLVEYSMLAESSGSPALATSGRYYKHVFGANQTTVERFLLGNKIMGPCWLRFDSPHAITSRDKLGASHCKYECELDMCKLSLVSNKPAPAVSVLSLALKTVVDPSTHQHQIVVCTGVFHARIPLDVTSEQVDEDAAQVKFQLVRPLAGGGGNKLDAYRHIRFPHPNVLFQPNERALLSCLMGLLHNLDADFICGHNIEGFELDLLLSRLKAHNIKQWSKLGRLNLSRFPNSSSNKGRTSHFGVLTPGRLVCDTYTSAQEFLLGQREYSLTSLCESAGLLKSSSGRRADLDPSQVPALLSSPQGLVYLLNHNVETCVLQLKLAFKLEVFTLTLELTQIAGNLWRRTLGSGRAERIEYLLSHAFHNQDYIIPDKEANKKKRTGGGGRAAPSYAGGLVLDPKPGLYDSYVVLLDFNALYPSIIQEFNICFTTVQRPAVEEEEEDGGGGGGGGKRPKSSVAAAVAMEEEEDQQQEEDADNNNAVNASSQNPSEQDQVPLPADNGRGPRGLAILPRVIQNIVDRRKQVQAQLKEEQDVLKRRQLDTRQKALKITANSMYGCLGFSSSRFFARPLASLITSQGRMILMDTVDTTERLGFKVLYGDTDSIMIDTQLRSSSGGSGTSASPPPPVAPALKIADEIIKAVNPKYKYLKIALDGVFKTLLLLKKKKYASLKVVLNSKQQQNGGAVEVKRETKGLDLVRRDWCPASQRLGSDVLNLVLSGQAREEICDSIRAVLLDFKDKLAGLPLSEFTITKGLNKHPRDYPDNGKSNPHVQVAKRMLERSRIVNVGDHIPFCICKPPAAAVAIEGAPAAPAAPSSLMMAQRAYHPDEVKELNLEVDLDWYVSTQLFPPVQRLVEVMDGISPAEVAAALGMDASKFASQLAGGGGAGGARQNDDDAHAAHFDSIFAHTFQADLDRFAMCDRISLVCTQCQHGFAFEGVCRLPEAAAAAASASLVLQPGVSCPQCNHAQVVDAIVLQNLLTLSARKSIQSYYHNELVPRDSLVDAEFKTRQLGLRDYLPHNKRRLAMRRDVTSKQLWIQLYYLVCLVDCSRFESMLAKENELRRKKGEPALAMGLTAQDREELGMVKDHLERTFLHNSAFGWVEPELFQRAFRLPGASAGASASAKDTAAE